MRQLIRWYRLLITRPNEVIFDLDTRWDVEKEHWVTLWVHHVYRRIQKIRCRFDRHGDCVSGIGANAKATCVWCRRVTDEMPKWY